jgi:hypothetical protein
MAIIIPSKNIFGIENKKPYSNSIKAIDFNAFEINELIDDGEVYSSNISPVLQSDYSESNDLSSYGSYRFASTRRSDNWYCDSNQLDYKIIGFDLDKSEIVPVIECIVKKGTVKVTGSTNSPPYVTVDWNTLNITDTETETLYSYDIYKSVKYESGALSPFTQNIKISKDESFVSVEYTSNNQTFVKKSFIYENYNFPYEIQANQYHYHDSIKIENVFCGETRDADSINIAQYLCIELNVNQNPRLSLYGKYKYLNITNNETQVSSDSGDEVIKLSNNELLQSTNTPSPTDNSLYKKTVNEYLLGKETATIICSISDYYDDVKELIISKDGTTKKMCFELYDEVCPMKMTIQGQDSPMSFKANGNAKTFVVLGSRIYYDGAIWQELSLQEKGEISNNDGTEGLLYVLDSEGMEYFCAGIGSAKESKITIASRIGDFNNGKRVVVISSNAFFECTNLNEIIVSDNIIEIGYECFYGCVNLEKVTLPKSLKLIRDSAFFECGVKQVIYKGTKEEWENIRIESNNDALTNATIQFDP